MLTRDELDNMQYSEIAMLHLMTLMRVYKYRLVNVSTELDRQSYEVDCELRSNKSNKTFHQYYFIAQGDALQSFSAMLLDNYGQKLKISD